MAATTTVKTKAQLLADIDTIFPDNHDEAIQPEHARDFYLDLVASAFGVYGGMATRTGGAQVINWVGGPTDWQDIKPFAVTVGSDSLTLSLANGTITVPDANKAGAFNIDFCLGLYIAAASVNYVRLLKNGATELLLLAETTSAINEYRTFTGTLKGEPLVSGDVLKLQVVNLAGAGQVTLAALSFGYDRRG